MCGIISVMNDNMKEGREFIIDVPHIKQKYDWDCGLACVTMVFRYLGKDTEDIYANDLEYLKCGKDVWTVDLAYLMKHHGIKHQMYTVTLGIHNDYKNNAYYSETFDECSVRINRMFEEASSKGVCIEKRSVPIEEIINQLKSNFVAICLVDAVLLECILCHRFCTPCLCCFQICSKHYQGHFVVICGYNCDKKLIYYKNPGIHQELCCSTWDQFDKARKNFGTDEDLLFIKEIPDL